MECPVNINERTVSENEKTLDSREVWEAPYVVSSTSASDTNKPVSPPEDDSVGFS